MIDETEVTEGPSYWQVHRLFDRGSPTHDSRSYLAENLEPDIAKAIRHRRISVFSAVFSAGSVDWIRLAVFSELA